MININVIQRFRSVFIASKSFYQVNFFTGKFY
jgi:hypothetical protein